MLILTVLQGPDRGRRFELPDDEPQLIGRSGESLPLKDQTISRRHAELTPDEGRWIINDLQSANGTFINGLRVNGRRVLKPGDQIRTGSTLFLYGQEAKVWRNRERGHNEYYTPAHHWGGDIWDTPALESWIWELHRTTIPATP